MNQYIKKKQKPTQRPCDRGKSSNFKRAGIILSDFSPVNMSPSLDPQLLLLLFTFYWFVKLGIYRYKEYNTSTVVKCNLCSLAEEVGTPLNPHMYPDKSNVEIVIIIQS